MDVKKSTDCKSRPPPNGTYPASSRVSIPLTNPSAAAGVSPLSTCSRSPGANLEAQPAFCEYFVNLMRVFSSMCQVYPDSHRNRPPRPPLPFFPKPPSRARAAPDAHAPRTRLGASRRKPHPPRHDRVAGPGRPRRLRGSSRGSPRRACRRSRVYPRRRPAPPRPAPRRPRLPRPPSPRSAPPGADLGDGGRGKRGLRGAGLGGAGRRLGYTRERRHARRGLPRLLPRRRRGRPGPATLSCRGGWGFLREAPRRVRGAWASGAARAREGGFGKNGRGGRGGRFRWESGYTWHMDEKTRIRLTKYSQK